MNRPLEVPIAIGSTKTCEDPIVEQYTAAAGSAPDSYRDPLKGRYLQVKIYLYALAIWSVLPLNKTCSAQATDSTKIVGSLNKCWRTTSHEYSTIYGLDEEEIKSYAKQKVCFTRDSVTMYYGALYDPKYSIKKVNAENFAKDNFDCSKEKLGMVEDSVFEITISSITKASPNETAHKMTDVI